MKLFERIADCIKSLMYYPTMKKYFNDRKMSRYNRWNDKKFARFEYA